MSGRFNPPPMPTPRTAIGGLLGQPDRVPDTPPFAEPAPVGESAPSPDAQPSQRPERRVEEAVQRPAPRLTSPSLEPSETFSNRTYRLGNVEVRMLDDILQAEKWAKDRVRNAPAPDLSRIVRQAIRELHARRMR